MDADRSQRTQETETGDSPIEQRLVFHVPQRQTMATRVVQILKRFILVERLEPGDRLPPERRLAESLNIGRMILRDALNRLIGQGILYRPSPRTLCVAQFDRGQLAAELALLDEEDAEAHNLIELRAIIEIGAIELIVRRATEADLRKIERWVVEGERRVAAREPIVAADTRFHAALLRIVGNQAIDALLPLIEEEMRQNVLLDPHQLTDSGRPDDYRVIAEHRQIFEAIMRRDVPTARLVMEAHLMFSGLVDPDESAASQAHSGRTKEPSGATDGPVTSTVVEREGS